MPLVEKEVTQQNVERAQNHPEFEKLKESEHKLTPLDPELLQRLFRENAQAIEQIYLSSPFDEASLRVRASYKPEGIEYTTTLKSRGEVVDAALMRDEVESEISPHLFGFYQSMNFATVRKLRAKVMDGVTVDFYDDEVEPVIVEVEHKDPEIRSYLLKVMQDMTGNTLVDRSGDPALNNEAIAYRVSGMENVRPPESLDAFTDRVFEEMITRWLCGKDQVVIGLTGMSGSGKSTVARALQERVVEMYGEQMRPIIVSTDDYHFGKRALEEAHGAPYKDWDAGKTYNTAELAFDIERLAEGFPLVKRHFDFATEEPVFEEEAWAPSPFVIIEGQYAGSNDLAKVRDVNFNLPTGYGTAVLRDVRRLVIDNRANAAFATPQARLRHSVEVVIPTSLVLPKAINTGFSESTRKLPEREALLASLALQG